eukprot:m.495881 g.495881  ORF g.495881 m.495881 type:complete len:198 (-) comp21803_c0_seq3:34-627(-)
MGVHQPQRYPNLFSTTCMVAMSMPTRTYSWPSNPRTSQQVCMHGTDTVGCRISLWRGASLHRGQLLSDHDATDSSTVVARICCSCRTPRSMDVLKPLAVATHSSGVHHPYCTMWLSAALSPSGPPRLCTTPARDRQDEKQAGWRHALPCVTLSWMRWVHHCRHCRLVQGCTTSRCQTRQRQNFDALRCQNGLQVATF